MPLGAIGSNSFSKCFSGMMSTTTSGKSDVSDVMFPFAATTCHPDSSSTYVSVSSWPKGHTSVRISDMERVGSEMNELQFSGVIAIDPIPRSITRSTRFSKFSGRTLSAGTPAGTTSAPGPHALSPILIWACRFTS